MLTISAPIALSEQQLMMVYHLVAQDGGEWFTVCNQHKRSSLEVLVEFLYSINKRQCFLLDLSIVTFCYFQRV